MQLFSADAIVFSKKLKKKKFDPEKGKKQASKVAHNLLRPFFSHTPAQATAHSPKLIFHNIKSQDQTSVLLFVVSCCKL